MNDFDMNGRFGNTTDRTDTSWNTPQNRHVIPPFRYVRSDWIPDVIYSGVILISVLIVIIYWDTISEALFYNFLLPVIKYVGITAIIIILVIILGTKAKRF